MQRDYRNRTTIALAVIHVLLQGVMLALSTVVLVKYPPATTDTLTAVVFILTMVISLVVLVRLPPRIAFADYVMKVWTRTTTWMLIMHEHELLKQRPLYKQVRVRVWEHLDKQVGLFHSPINRDWKFGKYLSRRFWSKHGSTVMRLWGWSGLLLSLTFYGYSKKRYERLWIAIQDIVNLETLFIVEDGILSEEVIEAVTQPNQATDVAMLAEV